MQNQNLTPQAGATQQQDALKTWVAPVVSESPVNEATQAGFVGFGADNAFYS